MALTEPTLIAPLLLESAVTVPCTEPYIKLRLVAVAVFVKEARVNSEPRGPHETCNHPPDRALEIALSRDFGGICQRPALHNYWSPPLFIAVTKRPPRSFSSPTQKRAATPDLVLLVGVYRKIIHPCFKHTSVFESHTIQIRRDYEVLRASRAGYSTG